MQKSFSNQIAFCWSTTCTRWEICLGKSCPHIKFPLACIPIEITRFCPDFFVLLNRTLTGNTCTQHSVAEVEMCTWVYRCIMKWVENKLGEENVRRNSRHASMSLGLESILWSQRRRLMLCIIKALWSRGEQRARGARCLIPLNCFTSSSYRTLRTSAHTQHRQACQWATHTLTHTIRENHAHILGEGCMHNTYTHECEWVKGWMREWMNDWMNRSV